MTSIKKNFAYQAFYEILIILMPLITSPYISRVLGAEAIGVYSYTYSIAYYFVLFAMLGISNYGNRLISSVRDERENLNKAFSSLLVLHVLIAALVFAVYLYYCFVFVDENEKKYALIQGMFVASAIFDINWFFFGLEEFKLSVTRNTIIKIISFISIFLFVRGKDDLYIYCIIMSAGILGSQVAVWPFLKDRVSIVKVNKKDLIPHIKPLFVLFIPVLAVSIYKIMDKVMLGQITTRISLGYYENAEKITAVFTTAVSAFGTVMMPRMNNLFSKGDSNIGEEYLEKSMRWMLVVTYAVALGVVGIAPDFVRLFWGKEFSPCAPILSVLACSLPFVAFASVIRMQYLIPKHRDREYIISVSGGAIVNLIINLLLIPHYAGEGAAIGTLCAEAFVCVYQMWTVRKEVNIATNIKRTTPFLIAGIIMCAVVRAIGAIGFSNLFFGLAVEIAVGICIYFVFALYFLQDEIKSILKTKNGG